MEDLGSGGFGCGARVYLRCRVFSGVGSEVKLWGLRFEDLWFRVYRDKRGWWLIEVSEQHRLFIVIAVPFMI